MDVAAASKPIKEQKQNIFTAIPRKQILYQRTRKVLEAMADLESEEPVVQEILSQPRKPHLRDHLIEKEGGGAPPESFRGATTHQGRIWC